LFQRKFDDGVIVAQNVLNVAEPERGPNPLRSPLRSKLAERAAEIRELKR